MGRLCEIGGIIAATFNLEDTRRKPVRRINLIGMICISAMSFGNVSQAEVNYGVWIDDSAPNGIPGVTAQNMDSGLPLDVTILSSGNESREIHHSQSGSGGRVNIGRFL